MNIGKACAIFLQIASGDYTNDEKGQAIMQVVQMPTHRGISKDAIICVIWYLLNLLYDLPAGAEPPEAWAALVKNLLGINCGNPYFASEESARACIAAIGEERLKRDWFGVTT